MGGWVGGYIREERGQKGKILWWWVCVRERRTESWRMMELQDTLGGLAVCKETSAAEEFGYVELRMNSASFGFPWHSPPPLPLSHCHSNDRGGLSFLHSCPHYFLVLHLSLILPLPPLARRIDWHEPISKTLISTKPQGTHRLQLFASSTQSCRAVRTHNDTEERNPWQHLNIINISWRWIWAPLLNIPLITTLLNFYFLGPKLWTARPSELINNELLD